MVSVMCRKKKDCIWGKVIPQKINLRVWWLPWWTYLHLQLSVHLEDTINWCLECDKYCFLPSLTTWCLYAYWYNMLLIQVFELFYFVYFISSWGHYSQIQFQSDNLTEIKFSQFYIIKYVIFHWILVTRALHFYTCKILFGNGNSIIF
jgi:hypothetical protein